MRNRDIRQSFTRYLNGKASPREVKWLLRQFQQEGHEEALREIIREHLESDSEVSKHTRQSWEPALQNIYKEIKRRIDHGGEIEDDTETLSGIHHIQIHHRWIKYSIAAVIALLIGSSIFFLLNQKQEALSETAAIQVPRHDIAPGGNKAILTLANGTKIILDSAKKGMLSVQGNTKVIKQHNGLLTYSQSGTTGSKTFFNTITTPRGGQYEVVLSDGSRVWLNAASSLHFPNEFRGETREVTVAGEAYFEVAKDAKRPFKVLVGDMAIQVLGTHFNVMAYKDEPAAKVTLLEGAVKVTEGNEDISLKPGEQADLEEGRRLVKRKNVDLQGTVAWKNNQFWFDDDDIHTVMRELARWYNVKVIIKGNILQHFNGYVSRDIYVSKVFEALQSTSHLQYKIQDSTIIVSP